MNNNLELIHKRNKLLLKIIIVCCVVDVAINLFLEPSVLKIIIPVTASIILILSLFIYMKKWIQQTMYIIIFAVYLPFIFIIEMEPLIINYIFIWSAFIVVSIYQKTKPVFVSWCIVTFLTIFYFYKFKEIMFVNTESTSVLYIGAFNFFLLIILILSGRFTENELWSSNEYLKSYFDNTSDAIAICDLNGYIFDVNYSFQQLTGYDKAEVRNQRIKIITEPYMSVYKNTVNEIKETSNSKTIETLITCKNDSQRYLILTITPIKNRTGQISKYVCIGKDITKLKQTEEALKRTEMLSVVGELAAGVAHEIKNPVTVIKGFVQLIKQSDDNEKRSYYYDIMESELERILSITNEFFLLGKEQNIDFVEKKMQLLLKEVVLILKAEAKKNKVNLILDIPSDIPAIHCSPNQLKQVFINIIKNGIESMPKGGNLRIQVRLDKQEQQVCVEMTDEGVGMTKETLERVGTPFYTTKQDGTGLGMMVSYKIIESHNGTIDIESTVNRGTRIKIYLPIKVARMKVHKEFVNI